MNHFEDLLFKYGILQFGRFITSTGQTQPFRLNLNLLPSYPDALQLAATEIHTHINQQQITPERILCKVDAIPLATLISTKTNIPLIYSRQQNELTVHDLVGAYDINHPTLLILNTYDGNPEFPNFIHNVNRVGLKVNHIFTLINIHIPYPAFSDGLSGEKFECSELTKLATLTESAFKRGIITEQHKKMVLTWIDQHH